MPLREKRRRSGEEEEDEPGAGGGGGGEDGDLGTRRRCPHLLIAPLPTMDCTGCQCL